MQPTKIGSRKFEVSCCGCAACVQRCPKGAISLYDNGEGFLYPRVDESKCVGRGICEQICPALREVELPSALWRLKLFAACSREEALRLQSSSGGIFSVLAGKFIENGGVVFGVRWDSSARKAAHDYAETLERARLFAGSKYVQSEIGSAYLHVQKFLKAGRRVLFSGTPCQITGLKRFLAKEYDNLFLVDIVCHGVPSPGVLQQYLAETFPEAGPLTVKFRDKTKGWKNFSLAVYGTEAEPLLRESMKNSLYLRGFLSDLYLRASCASCSMAFKLNADITLADYWNVSALIPEWDDDRGVSAVLIATAKGMALFETITDRIKIKETAPDKFLMANRNVLFPSPQHPRRNAFFKAFSARKGALRALTDAHLRWPRIAYSFGS